MSRINTNVASLRGLRNYNKANKLLDTSLTRLSTGLQINSGKDNPSGLIASETLRLEVTTIEQSIKNSNRANNVIATADGALGEIGGLLNQIRGLVQEGLNDGALSQTEKEANQLQIDTALSAINRISSNTKFAGDKLIDGSKAFNTSTSVADASKLSDYQINQAILGTNTSLDVDATVTQVAQKAELRYTAGSLTSSAAVEIGGSKGNEIVFLGDTASTSDIRDAINNISDATGVTARVLSGAGATASGDVATITTEAVASKLTVGANDSQVLFTRAQGGSDTTLGGALNVEFVNASDNATTSVSVASGTITVELADDGTGGTAGTVTATAQQVIDAINANTDAAALVTASTGTGDGSGTVATAGSAALTGGIDSADLVINDIRADSSSGPLSVEFASSGVADSAVDVQVSGNTLRIITGTSATLTDIATAFTSDADIANIATASVTNTGNNGGTNKAVTGGEATEFTDNAGGSLALNDARGDGATGKINLVFANPTTDSQALSVAVSNSGDDTTVTVNLATDANGVVTSTLEDIATAIGATTTTIADGTTALNEAVDVVVDGDSSLVVGGLASTELNEDNGLTVALESQEYGSAEFVSVNVLSGTFQTYTPDYSTASGRDTGTDIELTINGQSATGRGLSGEIRTSLLDASLTFAEASNVVGETATVSISGGGSLFQIGTDVSASGQVGIGLEAINTARLGGASGKLYELGTGNGKSLLDVGQGGIAGSEMVDIIDEALKKVTTLRGRLGSIQKNVIETNINTLGVALENISEARSQITDTDFAVETAALTKAQVLQQSGISVLAIANQNPQAVLSLLG